ncbi:MAG: hypothetical protein KDB27_28150 [Planctomycetales bacterium]|nr:hypothetical protein [Planctomycetales bacterium]
MLTQDSWGDFSFDGLLAADIELLSSQIRSTGSNPLFDLIGNVNLDAVDRIVWVVDPKQAWFGDANLDGESSTEQVAAFVPDPALR